MINDPDFSLCSLDFTYTDEQWDQIRTVVRDRLDLDADQIELQDTRTPSRSNEMQSLRGCFETAAGRHIWRSARESQTPGHKDDIKQLTELRDRAKALGADFYDALLPSFTIEGMRYSLVLVRGDQLDKAESAIATFVSVIEASIAEQRPQPTTANSSKTGRDRFWNEVLEIWAGIGGAKTGIAAARFLIAVSGPVFDRVHAIGGSKTAVSALDEEASVVEWLRLRAKARQAATS